MVTQGGGGGAIKGWGSVCTVEDLGFRGLEPKVWSGFQTLTLLHVKCRRSWLGKVLGLVLPPEIRSYEVCRIDLSWVPMVPAVHALHP